MLTPQVRRTATAGGQHSLATMALRMTSASVLRRTFSHNRPRSFWSLHKSGDWSSHLDPLYQRFHRVRTLKTRAKLLKNLRRRGKFEWDFDTKPFFTSKHVRWASHWDGKSRRFLVLNGEVPKKQAAGEENKTEEDGLELSLREMRWKLHMEAMRKRIEKDPYEAIFGKRFEPFWSPLVPSWMREEMGLQDWKRATTPAVEPPKVVKNETTQDADPSKTDSSKQEIGRRSNPEAGARSGASSRTPSRSSYSYASSTSWDSWSNKTRRTEWDSASGQTKKYEYDPISNRLILVEAPLKAESKQPDAVTEASKTARSQEIGTIGASVELKPASIPTKQSSNARKSIPIPPPLSQPSFSISVPAATALGPWKSVAVSSEKPRPSALARLPAKDEDLLTADGVRAKMGKTKQPQVKPISPEEKGQMERHFESQVRAQDHEIDAILQERAIVKGKHFAKSQWDQAEVSFLLDRELESLEKEKAKLLSDEHGLFHIERQKRELQKLHERIQEVTARVEKLGVPASSAQTEPVISRANVAGSEAVNQATLQSSLARMQSKDLPTVSDPDDSAAHESTEPFTIHTAVPKNWSQQAEMLQADRVRRTAAKPTYPMRRWIDDMQAKRAALAAEKSEQKAADAERTVKLEKANAMLEAEVKEQKLRMQEHEEKYAHKIRSLRSELEIAYKQSTIHSEKHLERIRDLEAEVKEQTRHTRTYETKYAGKIKILRAELEKAYKQSTVHSDKHLERIKHLETELDKAQTAAKDSASDVPDTPRTSHGVVQAEGDFCTNVAKFADSDKWYKQPTDLRKQGLEESVKWYKQGAISPRQIKLEADKAKQLSRDKALVKEVRQIYEKSYGVIDTEHRQPRSVKTEKIHTVPAKKQVVEVESDVDLGEALAKYEMDTPGSAYGIKKESLAFENEVAAREREYNEGVKLGRQHAAETAAKLVHGLAEESKTHRYVNDADILDEQRQEQTAQIVDDQMPKLIPTGLANHTPTRSTEATTPIGTIIWQQPALYKYLIYDPDSGMSVVSGTSEVGGNQTPMSVSQALTKVDRPRKFVKELTSLPDGPWKVVDAGRNTITLRKIADVKKEAAVDTNATPSLLENVNRWLFEEPPAKTRSSTINPIDGTAPIADSPSQRATAARYIETPQATPSQETNERAATYRDYLQSRRIHREEQHFTGTRRKGRKWHRAEARERQHRKSKLGWIFGVGMGAAGVAYVIGAAAEKGRERKLEEWERKLTPNRRF